MENTKENEKEEVKNATDDAVLAFLAENHPDDEEALGRLSSLLSRGTTDRELLETLYAGLDCPGKIAEAEKAGYLRGRNEKIEMLRKENEQAQPADDGGRPARDEFDPPLLRNMRRSVWD